MQLQTTYFQALTEEQRESARKSAGCTVESVKRDVQHLIEWLEKQPHLPNYRDEDVLAHILLHCKHSLEKTKRGIEQHFTGRALFPEIFLDRNPYEKDFEKQKNVAMYVPLRKLTPDGYRVAMLYLSDDLKTKTDIPSWDHFIRLSQITIELVGKLDYCRGIMVFIDGANISMNLLASISSKLQKSFFLSQKSTPGSYAKMYICNMGTATNMAVNIVKSLLKKKLANRIEILKKPTDICKVLPKEIIPREYGGDELTLKQLKELWFEEIKNNYSYWKTLENLSADLSKIPKDFNTTELSGTVGSFRQISVD